MYRREIRNAIRRDVLARIAHFIDQLFLDPRNNDPTARALMLSDDKRSVRRRLDDRKTDIGKIRNAAPLKLAVAARRLRATLDDVTGDRARGEPVPIVSGPAELVNHWREREAGVRR